MSAPDYKKICRDASQRIMTWGVAECQVDVQLGVSAARNPKNDVEVHDTHDQYTIVVWVTPGFERTFKATGITIEDAEKSAAVMLNKIREKEKARQAK